MQGKTSSVRALLQLMCIAFTVSPASGLIIAGIIALKGVLPGALLLLWQTVYSGALTIGDKPEPFFIALALVLILYVFERFFTIGSYTIRELHEMRITQSITKRLHDVLSRLPLEALEKSDTYDTLERIKAALSSNAFSQSLGGISRFLIDALSAIGIIGVLLGFHPLLAVLGVVSMLPMLITRLLRGRDFIGFARENTGNMRYLSYLRGLFTRYSSAREIRLYGFSDELIGKWYLTRAAVDNEQYALVRRQMGGMLLCRVIVAAGFAAALFSSIYFTARHSIDIGMFAASVQAFLSLQETMIFILLFGDQMLRSLDPVRDLAALLRIDTPKYGNSALPELKSITLSNAAFSYGERAALRDIDLSLHLPEEKGRIIAIVGENGAGKTTLAKLLLGLYQPTEGETLYNERRLHEYARGAVYARESAVFQDFTRYGFTLGENIRIGDSRKPENDRELHELLCFTGLRAVADALPQGTETPLGIEFGGRELSGGEWQRVAIARAFYREGDLLIFDEPTASLDPHMEYTLLRDFMGARDHAMKILISHRIGSARLADHILVLRHGRIVEEGGHAELLRKGGEYARLYRAQAQWYTDISGS